MAAVVLFGDPYFNGGDRAVDCGSFSGRRGGVLGKRRGFGDTGSTAVLSYCHSHDPICQGFFFQLGPTRTPDLGALTLAQHKNYLAHLPLDLDPARGARSLPGVDSRSGVDEGFGE